MVDTEKSDAVMDLYKYDPRDYFYTGFLSGLLASGVSYQGLEEEFKKDNKFTEFILDMYKQFQETQTWATSVTLATAQFEPIRKIVDKLPRDNGYTVRKDNAI